MKILKVWSSFQTELKYHDHYLSDIMREAGIETTFLSSDKVDEVFLSFLDCKKMKAGEDSYNGSKIIRLKSIEFMKKPFILDIKRMYQEICNKQYKLIHIFGIGNPITILTLFILKLCKKELPVIINDHSNPNLKNMSLIGTMYYKINIFLFSKLSNQVDLIITPNLASNNFIREHYSLKQEQIMIIPLGYDAKIFTYDKKIKNKSNKLLIGFAGKIVPGKKLELLIDVISEINDDTISCEIVGMNQSETKYQQGLREYAKDKNVNISFKPLIKDSQKLAQFYNYIDIAVFPGSISITTLEANGCGIPVIICNSIEGLEDRVEGERGFLFNTKTELKKYILYYLQMKKENLIKNQLISEQSQKYSWRTISTIYLEKYNRLIEK